MADYEMSERLAKQIDFIREADKEKYIKRRTLVANAERYENDSEHAWHMALMAILLSEYSNEKIDVLKTVTMILIHDIVEIDSGDTYAYDEEGKKTQHERELKAANRLFNILPEDQAKKLYGLWMEFEENKTPEARFAHSMDNVQPTILNDATNGIVWRNNNIKLSQVIKRNSITELGSHTLWDFQLKSLIMPNVEKGNIADDRSFKEKNE